MSSLFDKIFPDLGVPEYIPSSEVMISSLIWYELDKNLERITINDKDYTRHVSFDILKKQQGSSYELNTQDGTIHIRHKNRPLLITESRPRQGYTDPDVSEEWKEVLIEKAQEKNYLLTEENVAGFSEAIFDSLKGIKSPKSTGLSAIPFSIATALLQDKVGAIKWGPYNINKNINKMFMYGNNKHTPERASKLIFDAFNQPFKEEMLNIISDSILNGVKPLSTLGIDNNTLSPEGTPLEPDLIKPKWLEGLQRRSYGRINSSNPFLWFHESWTRLCSDENDYKNKLSARRYTDWAQSLARTGLTFSCLWSDLLFDTIANDLRKGEDIERIRDKCLKIDLFKHFRWKESGHKLSDIKINQKIEGLAFQGRRAKDAIRELTERIEGKGAKIKNDKDGLINWLKEAENILKNDSDVKEDFESSLNRDRDNVTIANIKEFYDYSMRCRNKIGDHADLYYVALEGGNNWAYIDPSPEWLVVISQLSKSKVGNTLRLRDVMQSIRLLGIDASKNVVSRKLEQIGLCNLREDADEGLEVYNGF